MCYNFKMRKVACYYLNQVKGHKATKCTLHEINMYQKLNLEACLLLLIIKWFKVF